MKLIEIVRGRTRAYRLVIEPTPDGGYVATCPALPGVVTEAETLKETLLRGHGAIACRLKSMIDRGLEVPEGEGLLATRV